MSSNDNKSIRPNHTVPDFILKDTTHVKIQQKVNQGKFSVESVKPKSGTECNEQSECFDSNTYTDFDEILF